MQAAAREPPRVLSAAGHSAFAGLASSAEPTAATSVLVRCAAFTPGPARKDTGLDARRGGPSEETPAPRGDTRRLARLDALHLQNCKLGGELAAVVRALMSHVMSAAE